MLHAAKANWNPSPQGDAGLGADLHFAQAANDPVLTASSLGSAALLEPAQTQTLALTTTPSFKPADKPAPGVHGMDTAMLALAFIGAWLMVVGGAMLARQFRLAQISNQCN